MTIFDCEQIGPKLSEPIAQNDDVRYSTPQVRQQSKQPLQVCNLGAEAVAWVGKLG